MIENETKIIEKFEKEKSELLKSYLIKSLKDIKKYMKASDEELYQRGVDLTREELKKGKLRLLKYLNLDSIIRIANIYEYFMNDFDSISENFSKCDEIIAEYKNEINIL